MSLAVENILGIIDRDGEEELALDLSSFSCGVNDEIQTFLTDKAIEFARKKMSITYLVSDDEDGELLGYFTLAHSHTRCWRFRLPDSAITSSEG
jgi:hypothetical protein